MIYEYLGRLTASDILRIVHPYDLFQCTLFKDSYRFLSKKWHPDTNREPDAIKVMTHINHLKNRAESGDWGNLFEFSEIGETKKYSFSYRAKFPVEIGDMYIAYNKKLVVFNVPKTNQDLFDRGYQAIGAITYQTKMLEGNFKRFIPKEVKTYETDDSLILKCYRGLDQVCLSEIIQSGYKLQPGHLAWIINGLYNFLLFMNQTQKKSFNGLDISSVFVNPIHRGVHVLGGWWFTGELLKKGDLKALPSWLVPFVPDSVLKEKTPVSVIDQIAIKRLAIRLLGDEIGVGSKLLLLGKEWQSLVSFLRREPKETLLDDYSQWLQIEKSIPILNIEIDKE